MQRCVIVGAARIANYRKIRTFLTADDFFIVCDGGLNHTKKLRIRPNLIVGDFDSHKNPHLPVETIVLPHEKDDTDSVFALKTALKRGFSSFLFIGMLGERFDHSLGNLSLLLRCHKENAAAVLIDDYSEFEIVGKTPVYIPDTYSFFSVLNISGTAKGICIKNALYNIENKEITPLYQYGISNEVPKGKTASVSVQEGELLLVKDW